MPKKKAKAAEKSQPNFEEAIQELQTIVQQLEEGTLGLEESLQQYEKGTALLRQCLQVLEKAEQRIEQISGVDEEGNPVTEPFDASATLEQREQTAGRRKQSAGKKTSGNDGENGNSSERNLF